MTFFIISVNTAGFVRMPLFHEPSVTGFDVCHGSPIGQSQQCFCRHQFMIVNTQFTSHAMTRRKTCPSVYAAEIWPRYIRPCRVCCLKNPHRSYRCRSAVSLAAGTGESLQASSGNSIAAWAYQFIAIPSIQIQEQTDGQHLFDSEIPTGTDGG